MARVSMRDKAAGVTPVTVAPAEPAQPADAAPAPKAAGGTSEATARINFEVPAELRAKFKAWAAVNGTSIKDELTRHIEELVG